MPLLSDIVCFMVILLLSYSMYRAMLSPMRWLSALSYSLAGLLFVAYILSAKTPWFDFLWIYILRHPAAVICQHALVWWPLIAVLLSLAGKLGELRNRRAVYIIAALVACWSVYTTAWLFISPGESSTPMWVEDVMIQSTGSTCIAAASCTYLRTLGVDMNEHEAVRLGLIGKEGGTLANAWRLLVLKLPDGYSVQCRRMDRASLFAHKGWLVTATTLGGFTGHAIAVQPQPDGETLLVRDPISGEYAMDYATFEQNWLKNCVWAEER